jgi:deoxyribonuclease-1
MLTLLIALGAHADEPLPEFVDLLPDTPSYTTAKKRLYNIVQEGHNTTFYCGCTYDPEERTVDLDGCGMSGFLGRALRVEVEHLVPASSLGATRPCWEEGGRAHCLKTDPVFKTAYSDLHNLFPTVGKVNGDRSNHAMGIIEGEARVYGACDFEVDEENDRAEPAPGVRGDIARVYFYMEWQYGVALSEGQRRLFLAWHQADPVDQWELERDRRIHGNQGNHNPFVFSTFVQ